jgi:hypothetical protein
MDRTTKPLITPLPMTCWMCGRSIRLEECKIDEHGFSVHEDCYAATVCSAQQVLSDRIVKDMIILNNVVRSLEIVIRKLATSRAPNHRRRDLDPAE